MVSQGNADGLVLDEGVGPEMQDFLDLFTNAKTGLVVALIDPHRENILLGPGANLDSNDERFFKFLSNGSKHELFPQTVKNVGIALHLDNPASAQGKILPHGFCLVSEHVNIGISRQL